jgi:hypothetical protein
LPKDTHSIAPSGISHFEVSRLNTPIPSTKQLMKRFRQKEVMTKQKEDVVEMLSDKKISSLIKQLRIPNKDDNGVQMMNGIYSLGTYIQSLVAESLKNNNLIDRIKLGMK